MRERNKQMSHYLKYFTIMLVLVCTTAQAQHTEHAKIKGKWFGTGHQIDGQTWQIALHYKKNKIKINYPTLACKGNWTLINTDNEKLVFKETIKKGTDNCDQGAEVHLHQLDKNRLKVVYYLRAYHPTKPIAEGVLTPRKPKLKNSGSDYAILNKGDTIYGKRYRSVFNRYNIIRFRTDTGKIKLPLKDVKEIYSKNKTSWVYLSPCDNRWEEYTVYLKGNVSYLWNGGPHNTYCSDMLVINNEIYPIDKHHFSDKVWGILSKCPEFEEKYKAYYNEHKDKKLFWRTRKDVKKWMEMIRFYNANCG